MTNRAYFLAAVLALGLACGNPASAQEPVEMSISDHSPAERIPPPPPGDVVLDPALQPQGSDLRFEWPWMPPSRPPGVPYHSAATLPIPPRTRAYCTESCTEHRPSGPIRRRWREQWKPFLQETHWGYCEHFEPEPYGATLHEAIVRQLAKAYRERLVLYEADFRAHDDPHPEQLTDRGRRELVRILHDMQMVPGMILIETSRTDRSLDERRQWYVQDVLQTLGSGVPAESVVVGPAPGGLSGLEAVNVFGNFLQSTTGSGAVGGSSPMTGGRSGVGAGPGVGAGVSGVR